MSSSFTISAINAGGDGERDRDQGHGGRRQRQLAEAGEGNRHDLGRQDEVGPNRALDLQLLEIRGIGHGVDQLFLMLVLVKQLLKDFLGGLEGKI